jgi:tryptophan 7-halogenase
MSKSVVVVGGGTAGWLTALKAQRSYPNLNITVIESSDIGILGAGEGSTPYLVDFFDHLNISLSDLIQNCDATIKNGIKFTNWNNDGDFYYHGFSTRDRNLGLDPMSDMFLSNSSLMLASISLNDNLKEIDFTEKISEKNKVPFILEDKKIDFGFVAKKNPILDYKKVGQVSIHFNATKLANRLKEIGLERGIKLIDGTIKNVSLDSNNNVSSLTLDNNENILCDFVFDCSGFHRLIIGKVYNAKWKSYKDFLPVDSAVPFFIEMTDKIPPYTEAIAMKYGWMWKIPLQTRFGCGYVYDSSLISEEDAVKEIEEFLGYEPTYPRKDKGGFKFSAGCYEEPWINNCVSIGLAANFVEPLEATSIWVSIVGLTRLFNNPLWIFENSQSIRDEYNNHIVDMNNSISDFIYFHYMTLRDDTEFWKKFSYENAPKTLQEKINKWQYRMPNVFDSDPFWTSYSWIFLGSAHNTINKNIAKVYLENSSDYGKGLEMHEYYRNYQNYKIAECSDHREFLEGLNEF